MTKNGKQTMRSPILVENTFEVDAVSAVISGTEGSADQNPIGRRRDRFLDVTWIWKSKHSNDGAPSDLTICRRIDLTMVDAGFQLSIRSPIQLLMQQNLQVQSLDCRKFLTTKES